MRKSNINSHGNRRSRGRAYGGFLILKKNIQALKWSQHLTNLWSHTHPPKIPSNRDTGLLSQESRAQSRHQTSREEPSIFTQNKEVKLERHREPWGKCYFSEVALSKLRRIWVMLHLGVTSSLMFLLKFLRRNKISNMPYSWSKRNAGRLDKSKCILKMQNVNYVYVHYDSYIQLVTLGLVTTA